ncbi:MAG: carboxylating nicotinate-nucleotide diphosphorylase [SAR202 cluster bacterium]|nr:carboxylating nicotinate-nucleotide diphosphorylase [SAR202 cluster bacterium]
MLHQWHGTIELIRRALAEDEVAADATSGLLPDDLSSEGFLMAKAHGVLAGIDVALQVFHEVDPALRTWVLTADGSAVEKGQNLARMEGRMSSMLRAERTALNLLQRMSGIATYTNAFVRAIEGTGAIIIDTRKTLPGFRLLDKYAVRMGGGHNHRMNLADGVLIKDNHIAAMARRGLTLADLVRRARSQAPHTVRIEVECDSLEQVREALDAGADIVMFDNMTPEQMRQGVALCKGRALTEASGGVTLESVRAIALTGVDLISTGQITHSVKALDISLEVHPAN